LSKTNVYDQPNVTTNKTVDEKDLAIIILLKNVIEFPCRKKTTVVLGSIKFLASSIDSAICTGKMIANLILAESCHLLIVNEGKEAEL
jgi:hypothetical protein